MVPECIQGKGSIACIIKERAKECKENVWRDVWEYQESRDSSNTLRLIIDTSVNPSKSGGSSSGSSLMHRVWSERRNKREKGFIHHDFPFISLTLKTCDQLIGEKKTPIVNQKVPNTKLNKVSQKIVNTNFFLSQKRPIVNKSKEKKCPMLSKTIAQMVLNCYIWSHCLKINQHLKRSSPKSGEHDWKLTLS